MAGDKDGNLWTKMEIKTDGTPEQLAAYIIDWARRNYSGYGMVPKLIFNEDGTLHSVEGMNAPDDILIAFTFEEAFAILNDGKAPAEFNLDPGFRYVHRRKGKFEDVFYPASAYHRIGDDGVSSLCGAAKAGESGYEIVFKKKKLLSSRICNNCMKGIKRK